MKGKLLTVLRSQYDLYSVLQLRPQAELLRKAGDYAWIDCQIADRLIFE